MSISDFIVVLSIIITLVTVVISNNKHLWLYKFDWKITIFLIAIVLFIHYLIFFDKCFYSWGLYFDFFMCKNGIDANIWAYIITVVSLLILILYVGRFPYFPKTNNNKIIRYYESLINTDIVRLMKDIDNYHKKDIDNYFYTYEQNKSESIKKDNLTPMVIYKILFNENFIKKSFEIEPIYFLKSIKNLYSNNENFYPAIENYFTLFINSEYSNFVGRMFIRYENKNAAEVIKNRDFFSLIFKPDLLFILDFEVNGIFGEAAYEELKYGNPIFNEEQDEKSLIIYKKSTCYKFLKFTELFNRYLIENNNILDIKKLHLYYINLISNKILEKYSINNTNNYANKLFNDCIITINLLLRRSFTKDNHEYIHLYVTTLINMYQNTIPFTNICISNIFDQFINLSVEFSSTQCSLSYFNCIENNKEKINDIAKEILDQMSEEVKNNKAYKELTKLFNIDEH